MVYLIHFDTPLGDPGNPRGQARHYIGSTDDLERRLQDHRSGKGAAILRACNDKGIPYSVVRTWDGGNKLEKKLKSIKKARLLCPVCMEEGVDDEYILTVSLTREELLAFDAAWSDYRGRFLDYPETGSFEAAEKVSNAIREAMKDV